MKEALKLALDALESLIFNKPFDHRYSDVLAAIKEALAQTEQSTTCGVTESHGEPVAYQDMDNPRELVAAEDWDNIEPMYYFLYKPLYDKPKSKPLTSDELKDLWFKVCGTACGYGPFARAIEAAHGITASEAEDSARSKT